VSRWCESACSHCRSLWTFFYTSSC